MDQAIKNIFENTLNKELISIVISNSTQKDKINKIKIRPVLLKGELYYQASEYIGDKIYHSNYQPDNLLEKLPSWFEGLFRQVEILTKHGKTIILISKKGKATVNVKKTPQETVSVNKGSLGQEDTRLRNLSHNKIKNYILKEGIPLPFLIDLGVMTQEGQIVKSKSDKFKQINRFLEFIEDILPHLDQDKELTILDFGCGKSYLTFAMYYYLKVLKGYHINVIGLDLKTDVIEHCNQLSKKYNYDKLHFLQGDIASYNGSSSVDIVVTLHACDTATDHALHKAITWGAKVILSVPCCQHELNNQLHNDILKPVLNYGIIKERMAALITDALRAELLETKGYRVQLLEFIDMEHTPKNILIRAVKRTRTTNQDTIKKDQELRNCMEFLGVSPCFIHLLQEETVEERK
jgi:SAM-dependent methyltransferase